MDDFQIWLKCKPSDINSTINQLNIELSNINQWLLSHGLKPNPNKTQAIIIGTPSNTKLAHSINHTPLIFNSTQITFTSTVKNLGLHIESDLGWYKQVSQISRKVQ